MVLPSLCEQFTHIRPAIDIGCYEGKNKWFGQRSNGPIEIPTTQLTYTGGVVGRVDRGPEMAQ